MMFDTRKINLLKEEGLEKVGSIDNDQDKHSGKVDGQDPTFQDDCHLDARVHIAGIALCGSCNGEWDLVFKAILSQSVTFIF